MWDFSTDWTTILCFYLQICPCSLHASIGFPLPKASSSDSTGRLPKPSQGLSGLLLKPHLPQLPSTKAPHALGTQLAVSRIPAFTPSENALSHFIHWKRADRSLRSSSSISFLKFFQIQSLCRADPTFSYACHESVNHILIGYLPYVRHKG